MANIIRFEELECWKKARELENLIYPITQTGSFSMDYGLKNQINRATGSIMDNIAEGFGRGGNKEFINFLIIAKGSCDEVKSQLYRASDRNHINKETFTKYYDITDHTARMIAKLINHLKKSELEGLRYKKPD